MNHLIRRLCRPHQLSPLIRCYSIYEPDYLDLLKPKHPQYQAVNFQIRGYDFPVLESYQKFLHGIADYMELEVDESWALPPKKLQIQKFKPKSAVIETEYSMRVYERVVQINNLSVPVYPLFLRLAQAGLPEGVELNVVEHNEDIEEVRYVPDRELLELKSQLEDMRALKKK